MDVEDTFNPTHFMGYSESNPIHPVSYVDNWFIYMWYNPIGGGVACKYILYTGIRNLAGGEFRISVLSIYSDSGSW